MLTPATAGDDGSIEEHGGSAGASCGGSVPPPPRRRSSCGGRGDAVTAGEFDPPEPLTAGVFASATSLNAAI
eukprot:5565284-Prymnesium_polylepis.1